MSDDLHVTVKLDEQQLRNLLPSCARCKWWSRAKLYPLSPPSSYIPLNAGDPSNLGTCHRLRLAGLTIAPGGQQAITDCQPFPTTLEDFGCVLFEAEEEARG